MSWGEAFRPLSRGAPHYQGLVREELGGVSSAGGEASSEPLMVLFVSELEDAFSGAALRGGLSLHSSA